MIVEPQRMAFVDDQRVRREASRMGLDLEFAQPIRELVARGGEAIRAQRERAGRVVEVHPRLGDVEPETVVPARRKPSRM